MLEAVGEPAILEQTMESDDLTIRVLIEIRDEIRSTNQRVDRTNERVFANRL